jgi:hypothetical protein
MRDRIRGALIGLAVGDGVETTVEFKAPGTFPPVTDMVGVGPFRLRPGEWTDDTSMALCLAESLIQCRGFDARDQMQRYVKWWRAGYLSSTGRFFDIGNTTRDALSLGSSAPASRSSRSTCRCFGGLLIGAMNGASKAQLLSPMYSPVPGLWEREPLAPRIAEVAGGRSLGGYRRRLLVPAMSLGRSRRVVGVCEG